MCAAAAAKYRALQREAREEREQRDAAITRLEADVTKAETQVRARPAAGQPGKPGLNKIEVRRSYSSNYQHSNIATLSSRRVLLFLWYWCWVVV